MSVRRAVLTSLAAALASFAAATAAPPLAVAQQQPTSACTGLGTIAAPCTLLGKFGDSLAAACRSAGVPDTQCTIPLSHAVTEKARADYLRSDVHRTAMFQSMLGDALPLLQAPWIGTHNSFNTLANGFTLSHADSNQQLTLGQQLDVDVRALELDLHYLPTAAGGREVVVCHGQGPDTGDAGCTNEQPFTRVLPEIGDWLRLHRNEVLLLYLEDEMGSAPGYASAIATLDAQLRRTDGTSMIYRPDATAKAANGCVPLPLNVSRAQVRASGAQVILVGKCAPGWSPDVFDWNGVHVESGDTAAYRPFPACDATYARSVYAQKLVRYYEDSTLVRTVVAPTTPAADPEVLTAAKVADMTACGVGLFGFDQLLPDDGRIAATIWSWADGQPSSRARCTVQGTDGRWRTSTCTIRRRAACIRGGTRWTLTDRAVTFDAARRACRARGARFAVPRSGLQNRQLRAQARPREAVWVAWRVRR